MLCREERLEFYRQHDIGFVARPPHGQGGYVREGRFKKASNMNYCLEVSRQVENIMQARHSNTLPVSQRVSIRPDDTIRLLTLISMMLDQGVTLTAKSSLLG